MRRFFDSVKNFVTHFVTPEKWTLNFIGKDGSFPWPLVPNKYIESVRSAKSQMTKYNRRQKFKLSSKDVDVEPSK